MNIFIRCLLKKSRVFVLLSFFSASCFIVKAQSTCTNDPNTNACTGANITQNFDAGNGNFSSTSFAYSSANKRWELSNPASNTTYSITSSNFKLQTSGFAQIGFTTARLMGNCSTTPTIFTISVIQNSNNQVLAQCNLGASTSLNTTICGKVNNALTLQAGIIVHYVISFTTGSPCSANTLTFDDFSAGANAIPAPVPVKLISFDAKRKDNSVNLGWQTASESTNKGFEIERKIEGEEGYSAVGFVPSKSADGNSSDILNYTYSEINIAGDNSYYRLKQMDLDGRYEYSDELMVKGTGAGSRVLVYPNPSDNGTVNVAFDSFNQKDIQLTDINGKVQRKWTGYTSAQLQLKQLRSGIYLLNVTDKAKNTKLIKKIVVL